MHWKTLSRNLQSQATERERESERYMSETDKYATHEKRMTKASCNSRKKKRR